MRLLRSSALLMAGTVLGAGAVIAHRISQETGRPFLEVVGEVPEELAHLFAEARATGAKVLDRVWTACEDTQPESDDRFGESNTDPQ